MYTMSGITVSEGVSEGCAMLLLANASEIIPDTAAGFNAGNEIIKYRKASREFANKLNNATAGVVTDKVRDLFGAVAAYITNKDNIHAIELLISSGVTACEAAQSILLPKIALFARDSYEARGALTSLHQGDSSSQDTAHAALAATKAANATNAALAATNATLAATTAASSAVSSAQGSDAVSLTQRDSTVALEQDFQEARSALDGSTASLKSAAARALVAASADSADSTDKVSLPVASLLEDKLEMQVVANELSSLMRDFISTINHATATLDNVPVLNEPSVIIASDLTPAVFLSLRTELVRAVVLEDGQASGHLATVLRDLCIPAIFGVKGALTIRQGEYVLVDATRGSILVEPPHDAARALIAQQDWYEEDDDDPSDAEIEVTVAGSMGAIGEVARMSRYLNHGLGLLRSEFLFLNYHQEPTVEEMTKVFSSIFSQLPKSAPLSARTFDFAGDKRPLFSLEMDDTGPLRKYGAQVGSELIKKEIRALLLASAEREIYIVFPLITRISEAKVLNELLAQVLAELEQAHLPHGNPHVALMIETPAAVLSARAFAAYGEMFIIGTSSLAEYASAPRPPEDYFTPALSKMIAIACKGAHAEGVQVGIAGRFGMRIELLPFFLALGVTYITTDATAITKVRKEIQRLADTGVVPHYSEQLYANVLEVASARDLQRLLFHDDLAF